MDSKAISAKEAASVAFTYAFISILWIILSDYVVIEVIKSPFLATIKGIGFVCVTALLLFYLIFKLAYKLHQKQNELKDINQNLQNKIKDELDKSRVRDAELIKRTRSAEIGEMIGAIAHHWRQPLNVVGISIQDVKARFSRGELTKEYLEAVTKRVMLDLYTLSGTIDDFYKLYDIQEEEISFKIKNSIESALKIVKPMFDDSGIKVYLDSTESSVFGYEKAFCRAITNILFFIRDRFNSEFNTKNIAVVMHQLNESCRITIEDNSGVNENELDKNIFDPYDSSSKFNSGLGLFVAKLVIEKHMNGKIETDFTAIGTKFVIELPLNLKPTEG